MSDLRRIALKTGLEQLSNFELRRILSYSEEMCFDKFNFDEELKLF